jgi:hypothetical protein
LLIDDAFNLHIPNLFVMFSLKILLQENFIGCNLLKMVKYFFAAADQFGSDKGIKFKTSLLRKLLLEAINY